MALRAQAGRFTASRSTNQQAFSSVRLVNARPSATSRSRTSTVVVRSLFNWPWGKKEEKKGEFADILKSARTMKRGCELAPKEAPEGLKLATFAGGCFWGIELAYQRVPGVVKTTVGYTDGHLANPTYEEVCSGKTGHTEVVQCTYDPKETTYEQLLDLFFSRVDPTTLNRQGNDRGTQYRSGIFYHDEEQRAIAEARIKQVQEQIMAGQIGKNWGSNKVVATLAPAGDYYLAEAYHQQYLSRGGRFGQGQSAAKGCTDPIRCYG